jgi:glycoside/pentoside/hexuronide:cation symporter, GPH family
MAEVSESAVRGPEKLSAWAKIKYAMATLGGGVTDLPVDIMLVPFYTEVFGVSIQIAAWIALAAGIWDAITDPILGTLSDRTNTRWGRRRPYLLVGAIPLGFSFWWLFNPMIGSLAASFLAAFLLFRLSLTIVLVPLYSLGAELSPNYDERTSVMGYVRGFWIVGLLVGVIVPVVLLEIYPTQIEAYGVMGIGMAIFMTITVFASFFGTKENPALYQKTVEKKEKLGQSLKVIFTTRPFWYALGGHFLGHTAGGITGTLLIYFGYYWMQVSEGEVLMAIPVYLICAILSVPLVWVKMSKKFDKKIALAVALFACGLGTALGILIPVGGIYHLMGVMVVAGLGYGGLMVLPYSMLTEVIDYNEIKTGERWEGKFYGIWDFLRKFGVNLAKFGPLMVMAALGHVSGSSVQTESVMVGTRLMFCFGPTVFYWIGALIILRFPISRQEHQAIRSQLEGTSGGNS